MANLRGHLLAGATVGVVLNIAKQTAQMPLNPRRPFNFGEMLAWGAIGATVASLPDILEPATSPFHRRFFHSLTVAAVVLFLVFGKPMKLLADGTQELLRLTGLSYLSHLILDLITPMGLPWI